MTRFSVHFQIVMDCTEYLEGDNMYEVYERVGNKGELEQIPLDIIAEVGSMKYKVWSVNRLSDNGAVVGYLEGKEK